MLQLQLTQFWAGRANRLWNWWRSFFAIVWIEKDKKLYGLNSSGPAPKNISIEKLKI